MSAADPSQEFDILDEDSSRSVPSRDLASPASRYGIIRKCFMLRARDFESAKRQLLGYQKIEHFGGTKLPFWVKIASASDEICLTVPYESISVYTPSGSVRCC